MAFTRIYPAASDRADAPLLFLVDIRLLRRRGARSLFISFVTCLPRSRLVERSLGVVRCIRCTLAKQTKETEINKEANRKDGCPPGANGERRKLRLRERRPSAIPIPRGDRRRRIDQLISSGCCKRGARRAVEQSRNSELSRRQFLPW